MQALLTISGDSLRREKRRSWQRLAGLLALLAVTALAVAWKAVSVSELRESTVFLKETVAGETVLYVEQANEGHLLRLTCGPEVDAETITAGQTVYRLRCRWNRLTRTGTVTSIEDTGSFLLMKMEGSSSGASLAEVFGMENILYSEEDYRKNPYGEGYLCDAVYWKHDGPVNEGLLSVIIDGHSGYPPEYDKAILVAENCVSTTPWDYDGDGEQEIVVRTRWPEKPYTVYDMENGELVETWPDTVEPELVEALLTLDELTAQLQE